MRILLFVSTIQFASAFVKCNFKYFPGPEYECQLTSSNMTSENEVLENYENFEDLRPYLISVTNAQYRISYIPVGFFSLFYNVKRVFIEGSNSQIQEITENTFKNGSKIEIIQIPRSSFITSLPAYAFSDCESLTYLQMEQGKISQIDANAFFGATNLKTLILYSNQLKSLDVVGPLPKLLTLNLSYNKINSIQPDFFSAMSNLTYLDMRGNICVNVDRGTSGNQTMESIAKIHLFSCFFNWNSQVTTTSTAASTTLNSTNTPTRTTLEPTSTPVVTTMTSTITNSTITTQSSTTPLPVNECKFSNNSIYGYTCTLSRITFSNESSNFELAGHHLAGKNDNDVVSVVFLRSNIAKVPQIIFNQFKNLTHLDISITNLKEADENTFGNCGNLKYLDASDNDIEVIKEGFLRNCKHLRYVWLENNLISSISPWNILIKGADNLKFLSLRNNLCSDESFTDPNFIAAYENSHAQPLRLCLENYLSAEVFAVAPLRQLVDSGKTKKTRNFNFDDV